MRDEIGEIDETGREPPSWALKMCIGNDESDDPETQRFGNGEMAEPESQQCGSSGIDDPETPRLGNDEIAELGT
jgi:hypothetical protein